MKVVYNTYRGGFGLSEEACRLLAERKGFDLTGWFHSDSYMFNNDVVGRFPEDIARHDIDLVYVVETLGCGLASGEYAWLLIKAIPDGAEYDLDIRDNGIEYVLPPRMSWSDFK